MLANYTMRSRRNAILLVLVFSTLPLLGIPLIGWIANLIVALVTLRHGAKESALVLTWALLPNIAIAFNGHALFALQNILASSAVIYCSAIVLRNTAKWSHVLQVMVVIGTLEIIGLHNVFPSLGAAWNRELINYFTQLQQQFPTQMDASNKQLLAILSQHVIGFEIASLFFGNLLVLLGARYLQAKLFNPQGLKPELYTIRVQFLPWIILGIVLLCGSRGNLIAQDCLFLSVMPFIVAGISLLHYLASLAKIASFWFIGFYLLLIFYLPYCAVALTLLALADSLFNFRQRYQSQ